MLIIHGLDIPYAPSTNKDIWATQGNRALAVALCIRFTKVTSLISMIIVFGANSIGLNIAKWLGKSKEEVVAVLENERYKGDFENVGCEVIVNTQNPLKNILDLGGEASAFISVCGASETNLAYCSVVKEVHNAPTRIARVDEQEYLPSSGSMPLGAFRSINNTAKLVSQVELIAEQIVFNCHLESSQELFIMLDYEWALATIRVSSDAIQVQSILNNSGILLGISREGNFIDGVNMQELKKRDIAYILAPIAKLQVIGGLLTGNYQELERGLCIVGGGGILGGAVASIISQRMSFKYVTLIEKDWQRAEFLASKYPRIDVVLANECSWEALEGANIAGADLYVALSEDGIHNVTSSAIAKQMNCKQTMCVLRDAEYHQGMLNLGMDNIININTAFAGRVMSLLYVGGISKLNFFLEGNMYCIETKISTKQRHLIGINPGQVVENYRANIAVVKRNGRTFVPNAEYIIQEDDRLIIWGRTKHLKELTNAVLYGDEE